MIFLDTGYLIARATPRDALHHRAKLWLKILAVRLNGSEYVIWKFFNALSAPVECIRAHVLLGYLQSNPLCEIIPTTDRLFRASIALRAQRLGKEWSLTDCISFVSITEALTHDRHFTQAGFDAHLGNDPL